MIELGLQRISRLLAQTPFPWRAVHVAGTNGKGSVCAYISAMLDAYNSSGYREQHRLSPVRHGRFTSPHLVHRWDSITINQCPIPENDFRKIETRVLDRSRSNDIGASEFEIQTATAFEAFTDFNLDVAVVEVGMGGRLDATNILGQQADGGNDSPESMRPPPAVTAITKIGLDHQGFLGNTIEEIAGEKAGIIKRGVPVIYDFSNQPSVRSVIERTAAQAQSPIVHWLSSDLRPLPLPDSVTSQGGAACVTELIQRANQASTAIPPHVQHNFSVAFRSAWMTLKQTGRILPSSASDSDPDSAELHALAAAMARAPFDTVIPGRQQTVDISGLTGRATPPILLDGAHNAQSAQALARTVAALRTRTPGSATATPAVTWVLAASDTKDVREILRPLLRAHDRVFAVEFGPVDGMPWVTALGTAELVAAARELVPDLAVAHSCGRDIVGALCRAAERRPEVDGDHLVVVAGSLYLVGEVHRALQTATDG